MSTKPGMEKRRKLRVDFKTQIVLTIGESKIHVEGSSKDLSLKGIFVNTNADIKIGVKCLVHVILTGMIEKVELQMYGEIVRKELNGVAIDFSSMDIDSYSHLKNIVRYNAPQENDPDDVY